MENITNKTFLVFAFEKLLTFQNKSNFFQSFKGKNFLIEKSLTIQDRKTSKFTENVRTFWKLLFMKVYVLKIM